MFVELKNQGNDIALWKIPAYMGIKGNEALDKTEKESTNKSEVATSRLRPCYEEG